MRKLFLLMIFVCQGVLATTLLTITRRDMGVVSIEYGTINVLNIGNKIVILDYTTDRIFKNGFEQENL